MLTKSIRNIGLAILLCSASANAELRLEAGLTYLSDEYSDGWTVIISDRFAGGKWEVGLGYIDDQVVLPTWEADRGMPDVHVPRNAFIQIQRIIRYEGPWWFIPDETGIGIAKFQNTNRALGKDTTGAFSLGWVFDRHSIRIRHDSNMGSGTPNMGQDLFTYGYSFGE